MKIIANLSIITAALMVSGCVTTSFVEGSSAPDTASTFVVSEADRAAAGDAPQLSADNRGSRTARGHGKQSFMEKYDTDGDGTVSEAEFIAERNVGYDRRDADSDGVLYQEEYVSEYEVRLLQQLAEERERQIKAANFRFTVMDTDDDELMTRDEFHASGSRMFNRLDTDKNGIVDENDTTESF